MAKSKYFPDLKNGEDLCDVEQVENAFSEIETVINKKLEEVPDGSVTQDKLDSTLKNYLLQFITDTPSKEEAFNDFLTVDVDGLTWDWNALTALNIRSEGIFKIGIHGYEIPDVDDIYEEAILIVSSCVDRTENVRQCLITCDGDILVRHYDTLANAWTQFNAVSSIKNLKDGNPTGSLISSGAGKVISENAVALGNNSVAGAKCFKITSYNDTAKTYTLDSVEGLAVGDIFSLKLSNNYDDYGSITAISGKVVTVDKYTPNEDNSDNLFRVAAKPECGTTDFGMNAVAIGDNCKAVAEEAFSTGKDNVSLGKYGFTMGKNCKAAYGSFSGGRDISVLGQNSFGFGFGGYIPGTLSIGMGRSVKVLENEALAFGYGAETRAWGGTAIGWKAISASNKQTAIGCNNIIDEYGKYLYILGNGTFDTRSNAHTVDWSGNAWYAGDVQSEKYGKLSEKVSTNDGANAVKRTIKSESVGVTLHDISPLPHKVFIKLEGIDVLPRKFTDTTKTEAGLTFTDNGDGSITVNGTSTKAVAFYFAKGDYPIEEYNKYVLSGCPDGGSDTTYRLDVTLYKGNSVYAQYKNHGSTPTKFEQPAGGWDNYNVKLWIASGQTFDNVKITPRLQYDWSNCTIDYGTLPYVGGRESREDGTLEIESTYPDMIISPNAVGYYLTVTYNVDTAKAIETTAKATAEAAAANKQDKINIDTTTDLYNDLAILKVNTLYKPKKGIEGVDVALPSAKVGDFIQVDFYTISTNPVLSVEAPSGIMDLDLKPEQNKIYSLYFDWGVIGVDSNNNINEGWRFSYTEYDPLTISE